MSGGCITNIAGLPNIKYGYGNGWGNKTRCRYKGRNISDSAEYIQDSIRDFYLYENVTERNATGENAHAGFSSHLRFSVAMRNFLGLAFCLFRGVTWDINGH